MRRILVFAVLTFVGNLFASDIIFPKNAEEIFCTVIGISSKKVTYYQKESKLLYPIFTIPKYKVKHIMLESGEKIVFKQKVRKPKPKPKPKPKIVIDTLPVDTIKIDTIAAKNLILDSIRRVDSIEVEEILKIEIPKKREPITCQNRRFYSFFAGYGISNSSFEQSGGNYSSPLSSFTAGAYRNFKFKSPFVLKFGTFLTYRKGEFEETITNTSASYSYTKETVTVSALDLDFPVLINFSFDAGESKNFRIYTDLGARLGVSLLRKYSSDLLAKNFATATPKYAKNELSLFNAGGIISLGAEINGKYVVETKYDFDITNRYKTDNKCKFQSGWLVIGYKF